MKKLIALLLAIVMVSSLSMALAEEKVNLTAFQYELDNQSTDFNEIWYFKEIEEQTGVHVDFRMVKESDFDMQLNLMFSTPNDMEDMILRRSVDVEDYGVSQGLILPLDEYLTEDIMPNYVSRLNMNNANASIPSSDGKSYYIGYLLAQSVNHEPTWYIDMDLLNKLNLEVPATIEDYTSVLRAFKADGVKYPLSLDLSDFGAQSMWYQFTSFGVPINVNTFLYIGEDEQVQFAGFAPGFRDALNWLHTLYAEELLDPETLTQDSNLWRPKVNNGEVGSFNYLRLLNAGLDQPVIDRFKAILPPAAEGYKVAVPSVLEVPEFGAVLTRTNPDPVASLKWIDAQLETENMYVAQNGQMGEHLKLNDEGKYEVIYVPDNNALYQIVPVSMGQFFAPGDFQGEHYQMAPHRLERYEDSKAYADAGVLEYKSFNYLSQLCKMNNEDSVEAANIYTELKKFMGESVVDFVKNGVTDATYDQFVNNARSLGLDRYLALYQAAYNDYMAK